jgi:hypothetical protein
MIIIMMMMMIMMTKKLYVSVAEIMVILLWKFLDYPVFINSVTCILLVFHVRCNLYQERVPYAVVPHRYMLWHLYNRTESITKLTFFFAQYYNLWNVTVCQSWSLQRNAFVSNVKSMSVSRRRAVPSAVTRLPPGLRASTSHRHLQ